ncbi:MAG: sigma 54-interacting transcriptional regulator [Bryobacterales bacterium]|nr:sigma 54-interacting transcriptional regulator [Bryobacterales bacterium]
MLEAVFEQLGDALVLYDRDRVIRGVNRAAERLLGSPAQDILGKACRQALRCTEYEPGDVALESLGDLAQVPLCTVRLRMQRGQDKAVLVRSHPIVTDRGDWIAVAATLHELPAQHPARGAEIIAESPAMHELMRFVRRVAASEATTILLEGENGVGKDLIATTLHGMSPRHADPFIAINCAALPETLIESELFGYEKGAFTDARQQKRGLFELADHGTLFLDEIGEVPLMVQAKLLRVLEDQHFRRLGGTKDIRVNVRLIAATNKNLREAVAEGAFRQDLYFRLNVIQITIPPLRERREDIVPLTLFFIHHYNRKFNREIEGVSAATAELLTQYPWPGNVRELRNAIERAMILEEGLRIAPTSLPSAIVARDASKSMFLARGVAGPLPGAGPSTPLPDGDSLSLAAQEVALLRQALLRANGNQSRAAQLLSISRDTLRYRMKKHGIQGAS